LAFNWSAKQPWDFDDLNQELEMKLYFNWNLAILAFAVLMSAGIPATSTAMMPQEKEITKSEDGKFQIDFENEEWKNIIEYFAKEAGYTLHLRAESYPPGTWTYHSDEYYTLQDAIDLINQGLRIREDVYTLVRNKKMLILIRERDGYPEELIETVRAEELESRGRYETIRCVFDVSDLRNTEISQEVRSLVERNATNYLPETGQLIVTATGEKLRVIRNMVESVREKKMRSSQRVITYKLKNITSDELLVAIRGLMGIPANQNQTPDGTLVIQPQLLGDLIFLKGTDEKITEFEKIAAVVDVGEETTETGPKEKPYIHVYPVMKDPLLAIQVVNTILAGKDVKLDQDKVTGAIIAMARTAEHQEIQETIDKINGASSQTATITLKHRTVDSAIEYLQKMFRQDVEAETPTQTGPIFYGDTVADSLVVLGKPQEIALCQDLIAKWDVEDGSLLNSIRSPKRVISLDENQARQILPLVGEYWGTANRPNRLNLVMPDDRESFRSNRMMYQEQDGMEGMLPGELRGVESPRGNSNERAVEPKKTDSPKSSEPKKSSAPTSNKKQSSSMDANGPFQFVSFQSRQEPQQEDVGKSSDEEKAQDEKDPYRAPEQPQSVPGAPMTVRLSPAGIVIECEDLDAADDMEQIITQLIEQGSEGELPSVFYLKFAKADEAKELLDKFLGIASSGGAGGGGGVGGMLGGMMSNMVGGAAGDMLGGLLGGGGAAGSSGGGTATWLESTEVQTFYHIRLNSLIVVGATSNDLVMISEFIDYIDQAQAPHDPNLVGKTYVIPVRFYDDVEALKKTIETLFSDVLVKAEGAPGQQGGAPPEQAIARAMQQALGGRGGGQAAKNPDEERPKARLALMERMLILTGPEYIYNQVNEFVSQIDVSNPDGENSKPQVVYLETMNVVELAKVLGNVIPGLEIEGMPEEDPNAPPEATTSNRRNNQNNNNNNNSNRGNQPNTGGAPTIQLPFQFPGMGGGRGGQGGGGGGRGGQGGGGGRGGQGGGGPGGIF
jgi:hypothetical protein